jgi:hypothetical protein
LIGFAERQYLEAKRSIHLGRDKASLKLAKDVSAMANAITGGVLVVGLATKNAWAATSSTRYTHSPTSDKFPVFDQYFIATSTHPLKACK